MNPLSEITLVALRELRKNVRSVKGIILGVLTLVVSALAVLICIWLEKTQREKLGAVSTEAFTEMRRDLIEKATGDADLATFLAEVPLALLLFLKFAVWYGSLILPILGFDAISGDLQHRTVRYFTVRTRRTSYIIGKFFGLWALIGIATLGLNVVCGLAVLGKGFVGVGALMKWGSIFWLTSMPIFAAWAAIAIFISSNFKQPILALLTTWGVFFILWVFGLAGFFSHVKSAVTGDLGNALNWYEYLYPNGYDTMILSTKLTDSVRGVGILVGFSAALTAASAFLFSKRDV